MHTRRKQEQQRPTPCHAPRRHAHPPHTTHAHARTQASHDNEDLTLTASPVKEPKDTDSEGKTITMPPKKAHGLSTWQAVLLWLVVIAAVLALVPRLLRMRRRPRSGMRSE